jgi:hypothetical protein
MPVGFEVVYSPPGLGPFWAPVNGTADIVHGMLVYYGKATPADTGGVIVMPAAGGACDVTNYLIPWGVVIGDNNATPVSKALTTALVNKQYITGTDTAAAQLARDWRGAEGMRSKGDPQPMVQVMPITPVTILKGYFRGSATVGTTNITETTATGSLSTTSVPTTATLGFTAVAENATACFTSGANAGIYRVRTDTDSGTTATTYTRAWPYTPVAGDKIKSVNVKQGYCRMNVDTTYGLWIDNAAALTADYYIVNVYEINLMAEAGTEYCLFSFSIPTFLPYTGGRQADAVT